MIFFINTGFNPLKENKVSGDNGYVVIIVLELTPAIAHADVGEPIDTSYTNSITYTGKQEVNLSRPHFSLCVSFHLVICKKTSDQTTHS